METATVGFIVSGLLVGLAFGFVLQRGRYCANTGFRDIIFMKDFTIFRSFLLALITMIIGANLLEDLGFIDLWPQTFFPFANIIGGFLFGIGMVLAGGCGSGILYRTGEGHFGAWIAVFGFCIGIVATTDGILNPIYTFLRGYKLPIAGVPNLTLWQLFGEGTAVKWVVIAILATAAFIFILKGKPFSIKKQKGLYWSVTGLLIGIIGIVAFWVSQPYSGFARGLNFTTPVGETVLSILLGDARPKFAPSYSLGPFKVTWASLFVLAVPFGAFISARILKEFIWKIPPVKESLTVFFAGMLMGFGALTAGGCTVGQGLTGVASLGIANIVATIAMILGNWTMVYYKFIKPMKD